MTSNALKWARKQGLNCELDIMAETLRQLCRISTVLMVIAFGTSIVAVIKVFGG
jgi:hypothetical protein